MACISSIILNQLISFQDVSLNDDGHTEEVNPSVDSSSRYALALVEEGWFHFPLI